MVRNFSNPEGRSKCKAPSLIHMRRTTQANWGHIAVDSQRNFREPKFWLFKQCRTSGSPCRVSKNHPAVILKIFPPAMCGQKWGQKWIAEGAIAIFVWSMSRFRPGVLCRVCKNHPAVLLKIFHRAMVEERAASIMTVEWGEEDECHGEENGRPTLPLRILTCYF